jgi:elongator complex protein 6
MIFQGIDFDKLAANRRFVFVDGLSGLFLPKQKPLPGKGGERTLSSPDLKTVSEEIRQAVEGLKSGQDGPGKVLLVVDQIDLLLAAGGDSVTAIALGEVFMGLREVCGHFHSIKSEADEVKYVHSAVMTVSADLPLVASPQTPLETNHAALLLSLAHQADFIMSLRLLDSGTARDVSGVVRITVGDETADGLEGVQKKAERELLYFVGGDGGVRVFERGQ